MIQMYYLQLSDNPCADPCLYFMKYYPPAVFIYLLIVCEPAEWLHVIYS